MASAAVPGTANVFVNQPTFLHQVDAYKGFTHKNAKVVTGLGVVQLATGIFTIVFQAAATGLESSRKDADYYYYYYYYTAEFVGCGIWCGVMFMIAGLLGVLSGKRNKKSLVVSFLALNIVISVLTWVLVGFAAANLSQMQYCPYLAHAQSRLEQLSVLDNNYQYNTYYGPSYRTVYSTYYYSNYFRDCSFRDGISGQAWKAMDSLLLILAILEFAIAITSAAYCCRALSCCCQQRAPVFVLQQSAGPVGAYPYGPSMQPIFLQQGSSNQGPVYTNSMMVGGPAHYSVGVPSVQLYPQFVHESMPPGSLNEASSSNRHCTVAPTTTTNNQQVYMNDPSAPPNYYEITD